jgi:carbamoyltransferase
VKILGISCQGERSSAALLVDGVIVGVSAESNHSRQLCDHTWPAMAIESILAQGDLQREELDWVALDGEAHARFSRVLSTTLRPSFPMGMSAFVGAMREWVGGRLWARETASKRVNIHGTRVLSFSHHRALARGAAVVAGQSHTDVLVLDAQSEWSASTTWHHDLDASPPLQQSIDVPYPHSIGLVVQALAMWMGLDSRSPWAAMSMLAQWGRPIHTELFEVILPSHASGGYTLAEGWVFPERLACHGLSQAYSKRWIEALGTARDCREPWEFSHPANQRYADMAASLQAVVISRVMDLARATHRRSKSSNLCVVGPLFEDDSLSHGLIEHGPYADVHLSGLRASEVGAIGAACLAWSDTEWPRMSEEWVVGDDEQLEEMIPHLNVNRWARFRSRGAPEPPGTDLVACSSFDDGVCQQMVDDLFEGQLVGWFGGRRKLTQRPEDVAVILADPTDYRVRKRETDEVCGLGFESSCLWVLEEDVGILCPDARVDLEAVREGRSIAPIALDYVGALFGGSTCVGVSRIFVVNPSKYPMRGALLRAVKTRRGLGVLRAYPMAERDLPAATTGMDALLFFAHSSLSSIQIADVSIFKRREDERSQSAAE